MESKFRPTTLLRFIPIFALAAILPVLLANSSGQKLFAKANHPVPLRIWLEPQIHDIPVNTPVEFRLMVSHDSPTTPINYLSVSLNSQLALSQSVFASSQPFTGKKTFAIFTVTAPAPGSYSLSIPTSAILTTGNIEPTTSDMQLTAH
jgi:hypothetical protein